MPLPKGEHVHPFECVNCWSKRTMEGQAGHRPAFEKPLRKPKTPRRRRQL
jgi:hypothetical protein